MKTNGTVPGAPRIVFVPGCWDLLHLGHLRILWRAKQLADLLIVGVLSDGGARAYKGRYPEQKCRTRMGAVRRLSFVDVVERQETTDPTPLLERFRPDVLVHGSDWARLREGHDSLARLGVEFVLLPYTPDISTTALRAVRENGRMGEPGHAEAPT